MKIYAPKYYGEFNCIADRCRHSCCVGWEIDVDKKTLEKYTRIDGEIGKSVKESIEYGNTPHFRLTEDERCPLLCGSGLCGIILELGEDYLCDICREHPRFYNFTCRGREVGLGMSCEEACRIILSSDSYTDMKEIGCDEGVPETSDFDAVNHRDEIYEIISDRNAEYRERLNAIYKKYKVQPSMFDDSEWKKLFESLEYLNAEDIKLFLFFSSDIEGGKGQERFLERALAYFIYRHCSEAINENEFRTALGFCLVCERLLASMCDKCEGTDIVELARILSEEIEYSEENTEAVKEMFN